MAGVSAHSMSDSDSDVTLEPDVKDFDNNTPDLFDSSDAEDQNLTTVRKVKTKLLSENHNQASKSKPQLPSTSKTSHVLSDSDSETEKLKEKILKLKKISTSGVKVVNKNGNIDKKPLCKFGSKCYRKNPSHTAEFYHPSKASSAKRKLEDEGNESPSSSFKRLKSEDRRHSTPSKHSISLDSNPYSFYLTKVSGIDDKYNSTAAVHISDILHESMGNLVASCQFNYMYDIDWLIQQYPKPFRSKPLLIVHGEQRTSQANLQMDASTYPNISLCQARLDIMYGTHHTKMMLLLYDTGMRVVITTANAIKGDWHQKTQGVWISPLFPKLDGDGSIDIGDSPTNFKKDLCQYIVAYRNSKLTPWEKHIKQHDMSSAKVFIIGSVPGRHTDRVKDIWGHLKLRKVLQKHGPEGKMVKDWPIIGQFSSIGSLGPTAENWVCGEWLKSLTASRGLVTTIGLSNKLQLIFPSVENIRLSLEGYGAGNSVPYSIETAKKQKYVHQYFRQWKSEGRGRSEASPHIKTYIRPNADCTVASWFLVTSANLSKAAWGALEKNGSQLMIRSYEIGVLFLPKFFQGDEETFPISSDITKIRSRDRPVFPLPYDLPPSTYNKGDRPWMWDVPCVHLPDTHGNKYCPPMK